MNWFLTYVDCICKKLIGHRSRWVNEYESLLPTNMAIYRFDSIIIDTNHIKKAFKKSVILIIVITLSNFHEREDRSMHDVTQSIVLCGKKIS